MEKDLIIKIQNLLNQGSRISEDEVRSLMILIRKRLELEPEPSRVQYSTLNLFCNWAAHTEITQSLTGLRILGRINDALVRFRGSTDMNQLQMEISRGIGFDTLYSEIVLFFQNVGVTHSLSDKTIWAVFLRHLIEIIRDVPLAFPPVGQLKGAAQKIYSEIAQNPIKPGAGVILINLSMVNYDRFGAKGLGKRMCLLIRMEDTTTVMVPLRIEL
jgi:hypothetical protein